MDPTAEGLIPHPSVDRLAVVGRWLKVNGESIYGTAATPFKGLEWGQCSTKPGKLYLHVFAWPNDGQLEVPVVESEIKEAYLLAEPERGSLPVKSEGGRTINKLPLKVPNPIDTVVVVEIER